MLRTECRVLKRACMSCLGESLGFGFKVQGLEFRMQGVEFSV